MWRDERDLPVVTSERDLEPPDQILLVEEPEQRGEVRRLRGRVLRRRSHERDRRAPLPEEEQRQRGERECPPVRVPCCGHDETRTHRARQAYIVAAEWVRDEEQRNRDDRVHHEAAAQR